MFYMNGVALVSRAKDYWDSPEGFPASLGAAPRANFGDAWKAYYENNGANPQMNTLDDPFTGKKAYFWSMIGDWTVRLRYRGGLAVLGLGPQLRALHVHADQAWIGSWNFNTNASTVRGAGDMDGDGASEFLVSSSWGIGILEHEGECWRQILVAPNGTRFGGWLLNTANDRFGPIADLDGDGRAEILVSSAWGITVLGLRGNTLQLLLWRATARGSTAGC